MPMEVVLVMQPFHITIKLIGNEQILNLSLELQDKDDGSLVFMGLNKINIELNHEILDKHIFIG